jgi:L-lactate dehydrogenase complex protein LldF
VTPLLRGAPEDRRLPFLSSLCGACTAVCPVGIDLHGLLLGLRVRTKDRGLLERAAFRLWRWTMASSGRYRLAAQIARGLQPLLLRSGLLAPWTRHREAPRLARHTFRDLWSRRGPPARTHP